VVNIGRWSHYEGGPLDRFHCNLVLNLDIMNISKFITKNSSHSTLRIGYKEKYVEETMCKKFLSLQIDNHINWKHHIGQIIPKLCGTCYAVMSMVHISNINALKSIYCHAFVLL
jgi:hypothetical protein